MAIKNLIRSKTDDLGFSNEITCPSCKETVKMRIFSNYDLDNYLAMLLKKSAEFNFAVCPKCETVFKINKSVFGIENEKLRDYDLLKISRDE